MALERLGREKETASRDYASAIAKRKRTQGSSRARAAFKRFLLSEKKEKGEEQIDENWSEVSGDSTRGKISVCDWIQKITRRGLA